MLDDWFGLAGEQRLVDLEAVGGQDGGVYRHLVADPEVEDVVLDELARGDLR